MKSYFRSCHDNRVTICAPRETPDLKSIVLITFCIVPNSKPIQPIQDFVSGEKRVLREMICYISDNYFQHGGMFKVFKSIHPPRYLVQFEIMTVSGQDTSF